jgi:hypothetical protein
MSPRRAAVALALALAAAPAAGQDDDDNEYVKARAGKFKVELYGAQTRLVYNNILRGTQFNDRWHLHNADVPNMTGLFTQWESLAIVGGCHRWYVRDEPLTYYHRTGPIGAVFHHLRTRKGGADAAAPIGVLGLYTGTPAAYARRGQSVTFYTYQPEIKQLVADTDRWFTYLSDARTRGAAVDVKYGPVRKTLAADADARYAVLLVELIEDSFNPGDLLTLEAVRLYLDRLTPDGLLALHISNKNYRLEPVAERIARELKLVGRVWHDDERDNRPGKTAASWVVLARTDADLGPLGRPLLEQVTAYGTASETLARLLTKYPPETTARAAFLEEWGVLTVGPKAATPPDVQKRVGPAEAALVKLVNQFRDAGEPNPTLARVAQVVFKDMFRPLQRDDAVDLRTDAHRPGLPVTDRSFPRP